MREAPVLIPHLTTLSTKNLAPKNATVLFERGITDFMPP